ncbi:MAG: glycosyltransferase, partial [candidate division WOR-3 bacterium]
MRILHTNMHRGGWGGQANRILEKSKGLIKMGYEVIIAAPKGATLIERARIFGIDVFDNLTLSKKFNLIYFVKDLINMVLLMKSKRVDVVHTHGSQDSWVASIAARIVDSSIPIVRTRHNIFTVRTHWFNKLLYRILTDYLVAISFAVFDVYKKNGVLGKSIEKVKVIYSAVPVEQVIGDRVTEKEHEFVVVNVGRLAREKAQEFFVKFVSKLKTKLKLKAFILGEGPREHFLRSMSRELKVDDVLVFTGLTDKVKEFLSVADLLVSTSVSEGLG